MKPDVKSRLHIYCEKSHCEDPSTEQFVCALKEDIEDLDKWFEDFGEKFNRFLSKGVLSAWLRTNTILLPTDDEWRIIAILQTFVQKEVLGKEG